MKATGTKVSLRGVGTGIEFFSSSKHADDPCNEPMHLLVSSNLRNQVEKGRGLCEDLLNHVRQEYYQYV